MPAEVVVEAASLAKRYGPLKALGEVSFEVRPGEILGFIGADDAGKTTVRQSCSEPQSPALRLGVVDESLTTESREFDPSRKT